MNRSALLPLLFVVACAGSKDGDTSADTDSSPGDTYETDPDFDPYVVSVDSVACAEYQSAGESWDVSLTVNDPQGPETVSDGSVTVLNAEGGELATYVLACGNGQCFGSFRSSYDGIGCDLMGQVTLRFVVTDDNGNASHPSDYPT